MPYDAELHINYYIHMLLKVLYIPGANSEYFFSSHTRFSLSTVASPLIK